MAPPSRSHRLAALSLLLAAGCRDPGGEERAAGAAQASLAPGVTEDTIRIGSYGPLSGPAAAWGTTLHAMEAYFRFINDHGGIHGRRLALVSRDDQYSPAKTPTVVRDLVENEGVFAIVGGIGTANGRAVADYLEHKGVPFFTPASGDSFFTDPGRRNIYTVYPRYDTEGRIMGEHIARTLGAKRVGVLHQDDDFGHSGKEGLAASLARFGAELVVEATCLASDTDLAGQVSRINAARPEVLVLFTAPRQAVLAVRLLEEQKKKPQLVTSFVLSDPVLFELAGAATWEGTLTSASRELADADTPAARRFREVLAKYGGGKLRPGGFTTSGFHFAMPFVEALDRAGPELTREALYRALESFDRWEGGGPYWGAGGLGPPITFAPDRRLGADQIFFARAVNGRWVRETGWLSASP